MPHVPSSKGQVKRSGHMNKSDMQKTTPTSSPRDDLRTAYSGDENRGPASNKKTRPHNEKIKGRRLPADSEKTPIR